MDDQLRFSELLQNILGSERTILCGDKEIFEFAMKIDELEELLEQDDIHALFWVNQHNKKKGRDTRATAGAAALPARPGCAEQPR